jgi:hypothetical protein
MPTTVPIIRKISGLKFQIQTKNWLFIQRYVNTNRCLQTNFGMYTWNDAEYIQKNVSRQRIKIYKLIFNRWSTFNWMWKTRIISTSYD